MNAQEALTLCRMVKGACPQQAMDEYTPDAWHMLLEPYRFEDCRQAVIDITRREPFVSPAEIIERVKQIRTKRIDDFGPFDPPAEVADYNRWLGETRRRIADGELTVETYRNELGLKKRDVPKAIEGAFQRIPAADNARANLTQARAGLCSHGIRPETCKDRHETEEAAS